MEWRKAVMMGVSLAGALSCSRTEFVQPPRYLPAARDYLIDSGRMLADISELTSAKYQGRLTGTKANEAAVDWVEGRLLQIGLVPLAGQASFRQSFSYRHWTLLNSAAVLGESPLSPQEQYQVLEYSPSGKFTAELVFVGYGLSIPSFDPKQYPQCGVGTGGYDDYSGSDITGKVALILRHGPGDKQNINRGCPSDYDIAARDGHYSFSNKGENARRHGAIGVIITNDFGHGTLPVPWGSLGFRYPESAIPVVGISNEAMVKVAPLMEDWQAELDGGGTPTVRKIGESIRIEVTSQRQQKSATNLVATVDSDRFTANSKTFLLSSHVDHLGMDSVSGRQFPGADDNASGVAVILELARAFRNSSIDWVRRPILAIFNGEEQQMVGSCYYVAHPMTSLDSLVAMASVDMVGNGNGTGLSVYGGEDPKNRWIFDAVKTQSKAWGFSYAVQEGPAWEASDHACFIQNGTSSILAVSSGAHPNTHTIRDSVDLINPQSLESTARVLWAGVSGLAEGKGSQ